MATSTGGEATEVLSPAEPGALTLIRARGRWRGPIGLFGPAFMAAVAGIDPGDFARVLTGLVPQLNGSASVVLAAGIVGATVMPPVDYLPSAPTRGPGAVPRRGGTSEPAALPADRRRGRARPGRPDHPDDAVGPVLANTDF